LRGGGVGSLLFGAVEDWARRRGCAQLKIETQNINVPACHFYARMACTLGSIDRHAYPELPEETQLVWYKDL
jgi:GNAT superfamily N-acetyltransferase